MQTNTRGEGLELQLSNGGGAGVPMGGGLELQPTLGGGLELQAMPGGGANSCQWGVATKTNVVGTRGAMKGACSCQYNGNTRGEGLELQLATAMRRIFLQCCKRVGLKLHSNKCVCAVHHTKYTFCSISELATIQRVCFSLPHHHKSLSFLAVTE